MPELKFTPEQVLNLSQSVVDLATESGPIELALSALLSAYFAAAMSSPAGLQECANLTFQMSMRLAKEAAVHRQASAVQPSTVH